MNAAKERCVKGDNEAAWKIRGAFPARDMRGGAVRDAQEPDRLQSCLRETSPCSVTQEAHRVRTPGAHTLRSTRTRAYLDLSLQDVGSPPPPDFEPNRPAPMAPPRRLRRDGTVCRASRTGPGAQTTHPFGNEAAAPAVSRSGRRSRNLPRPAAAGVPSRAAGDRQVRSAVVERNRRGRRALGVRMECQGNVVEVRERARL